MMKKVRSCLKWAGGKYRLLDSLLEYLPEGKRLVEPFLGSGTVFLNTDYSHYLLNDINVDIINLFSIIQDMPEKYLREAHKLFHQQYNCKEAYYELRKNFNKINDSFDKSLLFLYLNRHGYNGLCRYNQSGNYNVPFGFYKKPYFPEKEILFFAQKLQYATLTCKSFQEVFLDVQVGDVVYCDPPYLPLSDTANFMGYHRLGFSMAQQRELVECAIASSKRAIFVLISNHDTVLARRLYCNAMIEKINVTRTISRLGHTRKAVGELFAIYS